MCATSLVRREPRFGWTDLVGMTNAARITAPILAALGLVLGLTGESDASAAECRFNDMQTSTIRSDIEDGPSCTRYWSRTCGVAGYWLPWSGIGCRASRTTYEPATCCKNGTSYACTVRCEQKLDCPPAYHLDQRCKLTTECEKPPACGAR